MALIQQLFHRKRESMFQPTQFGPPYRLLNSALAFENSNIEILDGPLRNLVFKIEHEITDCQSRLFLITKESDEVIGRALCERNRQTSEIIYWDVMVQEKFRMKGLASLMTKFLLHQLITIQKKAKIMIRMIKLYQPTDTSIKLQNVGIGVIARRLGLKCEFDLLKLLNPLNITKIEILPPEGNSPPCYKIVLQTYPYVLIGFIVDPRTLKPIFSLETYKQMLEHTEIIEEWIRTNTVVIGNGNYILAKEGIEDLISCIATDQYEAENFRTKIQGK